MAAPRSSRLHVYRLPERLADGYAFGGGNPVAFLNVDWFDVPCETTRDAVTAFIARKRYFDPQARFLVLASFALPTLTFTVEPADGDRGQ